MVCLKFNVNFCSSVQNAIQRPALCLFPLCKYKIVCLGYFSFDSIMGFNNNEIRDRYIKAKRMVLGVIPSWVSGSYGKIFYFLID